MRHSLSKKEAAPSAERQFKKISKETGIPIADFTVGGLVRVCSMCQGLLLPGAVALAHKITAKKYPGIQMTHGTCVQCFKLLYPGAILAYTALPKSRTLEWLGLDTKEAQEEYFGKTKAARRRRWEAATKAWKKLREK